MSETPRCDAFGDEPYKGDNARLVLLWIRFAESLERDLTQAKAELAAVRAEYSELLYAVVKKWPGESRHQTALRYINECESRPSNGPNCAAREQHP